MLLVLVALLHTALVLHLTITGRATGPEWDGLLRIDSLGLLFSLDCQPAVSGCRMVRAGLSARRGKSQGSAQGFRGRCLVPQCAGTYFHGLFAVLCQRHEPGPPAQPTWDCFGVGVETTTLASAPLIYFHRHQRSLEATWKYLMICSVGIALALMGNILLSISMVGSDTRGGTMLLADLLAAAPGMQPFWLKAAFIFLLVGYGTKMGLAPMHNWLPDAHSESPSLVSALLSGALLNCAFLGILRAHQICTAAGIADFSSDLLVFFGLLSMVMAAIFIVGQGDYKRLLAYSSVEHMGILALGVGIGGGAAFGAMFHAVNHSLTKAGLFLTGREHPDPLPHEILLRHARHAARHPLDGRSLDSLVPEHRGLAAIRHFRQ